MIEGNEKTLSTLANAWNIAMMYPEAIEVYKELLTISNKEKYKQSLSFLYIESRLFDEAINLIKTSIKQDGEYFTLLGYLYYEIGQLENSQKQYQQALGFEETIEQAQNWLSFLKQI